MRRTLLFVLTLIIAAGACAWSQEAVLRLSEADAKKAVVTRVEPSYPVMAKQMKITGRVQVDVFIEADGSVEKVQVLNGNIMLANAASQALKMWKFAPAGTGRPAKAVATLTFDFKL